MRHQSKRIILFSFAICLLMLGMAACTSNPPVNAQTGATIVK